MKKAFNIISKISAIAAVPVLSVIFLLLVPKEVYASVRVDFSVRDTSGQYTSYNATLEGDSVHYNDFEFFNNPSGGSEGWTFSGWYGDEFVLVSGDTVAIDNTSLRGWWGHTISVVCDPTVGGTASAAASSSFSGDRVSLTAVPNTNYAFDHWVVTSGDATILCDYDSSAALNMGTTDTRIKAVFRYDPSYTVTVTTEGNGRASASPTSATSGTNVTLTATANAGNEFVRWDVTSNNIDINTTNNPATFRMPNANVTVKAVFRNTTPSPTPTPSEKKKSKDDSGENESEPSPTKPNNVKVPDGCDPLRVSLSNAIASAATTGKPQTIYWSKGTSLPADVMKMLHDNPKVTLVFSYIYKDVPFILTIPGSAVVLNPAVEWYGPAYLYALYGKGTTAALTTNATVSMGTYTIKSGDTLSGIAERLRTTVKNLQNVNNIKDADKIKSGMVLKY